MKNLEQESQIKKVGLFALPEIPLIQVGDDIGMVILQAIEVSNFPLEEKDVIVIAHKIVSRAEGRIILLSEITPTREAEKLARKTGRSSQLCQVIINESKRILYTNGQAIITEHHLGFINTSSGVDRSNSGSGQGDLAVLLPEDPDKSARKIRETVKAKIGREIAVIIADSFGRPWRKGSVGMAIGVAGINPLKSKEQQDLAGRLIKPEIALVDEIAASASMLMGQADEGRPVVVVRGVDYFQDDSPKIQDLLRPYEEDQIWE